MKATTRRFIACALCTAVIFAAVVSSLFIIHEIDHNCTGADCTVCACIHAAEEQLEQLGSAGIKAARAVAVLLWCAAVCRIFSQNVQKASPVHAKVRMNN